MSIKVRYVHIEVLQSAATRVLQCVTYGIAACDGLLCCHEKHVKEVEHQCSPAILGCPGRLGTGSRDFFEQSTRFKGILRASKQASSQANMR